MSDFGINLAPLGERDDRSFMEKMKVPWYFDTIWGKAYILLTTVISVFTVYRFIYALATGGNI